MRTAGESKREETRRGGEGERMAAENMEGRAGRKLVQAHVQSDSALIASAFKSVENLKGILVQCNRCFNGCTRIIAMDREKIAI